jgi:RHS repeat-associated protein
MDGWAWNGYGYVSEYQHYDSSGNIDGITLGMTIGGDINGGIGTEPAQTSPTVVSDVAEQNTSAAPNPSTSNQIVNNGPQNLSAEPVDMAGGAYVFDHTDLAAGGASPLGLAFSRSYNSNQRVESRKMGYGWTHNYDIRLGLTSHGDPGLGTRKPSEAAAMIAALHVTRDLLQNEDNARGWTIAAIISNWAVDQLIDNAMTVYLGHQLMEYIKLPDGSYSPPPGVTTQLTKNSNNLFLLKERFGAQMLFNDSNRISQWVDADGNVMSFSYVGDDLSTVTDAFGRTLTLGYTDGRISTVSSSAGGTVQYAYDSAGNLATYTDPEEKGWSYDYDGGHRMTSLANPLGTTTAENTYDALGRVSVQKRPLPNGDKAEYSYYFSGFRNVEKDPQDGQTIYYYDSKGRATGEENPIGAKVSREYDGQNHIVKTVDPLSNLTEFTYDKHYSLTQIKNPLDEISENAFDTSFRLTAATDPLGHAVSYAYGDSSHPYSVTAVSASPYSGKTITTGFTYHGNGLKKTSTDGKGCTTTFTYDSYGNPDTAKTAAHTAIDYGYNARGEMTSLTDQKGSTTTFAYDNRGLLTTKADPNEQTSSFTYNDDGSPHTATDRKGRTTTFTHTPSGKLATTAYAGGSTVTLGYDSLDRLTSMTDALGTTSYRYDAAGRLVSTTDAQGVAIAYTYDAAGNITKITYPGNKSVSYTYDALNRLKTAKIDFIASTPTATYTYDAAGRMTGLTQFNGTTATYGYDNANRLTSLQNATSGGTTLAGYSFTLDDNGNRTTSTVSSALTFYPATQFVDYGYSDAGNRLTRIGAGTSLEYDAEGQLSKKGSITCTFDDAHRMTATSSGSSTFYYDGANRRLKAVRNGVTRRYIHDALGNLLAEADGSGVILRYFIYGKGLLAAVDASTGALYCYHFDATGNTVAMTNASQAVVNQYAYTPFGEIAAKSETWAQPFTYVGQYGVFQESDNIYYMRARYYDASVGRFISEDPKGLGGGDVNLYVYVRNNPLMFIDPLGLEPSGFGVSVSHSNSLGGNGSVIDSSGNEAKSLSLLTLVGSSIDINLGDQPNADTVSAEIGIGLGSHLGIGFYFFGDDAQYGGISIHIGLSIGSPIYISATIPHAENVH